MTKDKQSIVSNIEEQLALCSEKESINLFIDLASTIGAENRNKSRSLLLSSIKLSRKYYGGTELATKFMNIAEAYAGLEDVELALTTLEEALNLYSIAEDHQNEVECLKQIASCHLMAQVYDDAILTIRKAINLTIKHNLENLAELYFRMGNTFNWQLAYEKAQQYLTLCMENFDEHTPLQIKMIAPLSMAILHNKTGKPKAAIPILEAFLADDKKTEINYNYTLAAKRTLANSLNKIEKFKESEQILLGIINDPAFNENEAGGGQHTYQYLSECYEGKGEMDKALTYHKIYLEKSLYKQDLFTKKKISQIKLSYDRDRLEAEAEINRLKNIELKKAEAALKSKLKQLSLINDDLESFNFAISHDLKEPIWNLINQSNLLKESLGDSLDEKQKMSLDYIAKSGESLNNMIQGLIHLIKIDRQDSLYSDLNLGKIMEACKLRLADQIKVRDVSLIYDEGFEFRGHETLVTQLFQNLILNSIKYNNRKPEISVTAYDTEGDWTFEIKDNGIGINPKEAVELFRIYRRGGGSTAIEGTGIGLALCSKIVTRHKGEITIAPNDGEEGSVVKFTIGKM